MQNNISYSGELYRKCIHMSSSIFAFILYFFGKEQIIIPLILITIIYVLLDYGRKQIIVNNIYLKFFSKITRSKEKQGNLTGASYVFMGITFTVIFFDPKIAIPAILIMSLSDSISAIIGRKYNHTKINKKTLEGSTAFYFSTLIILFCFNFNIFYSFFISLILVIVEYYDKLLIDDNLSIPIFASILIQMFLI